MKFIMTAALIGLSATVYAAGAGTESKSADAQAIDSACAADAATAGCGSEKVGTGMLRCIRAYRKSHKDWKPSATCHAAMEKMHADKKAGKM